VRVSWLELCDFRCHDYLRFDPDEAMNVLIGPNGAGKTSILEAVAFASNLRSFRRSPDTALIRQDRDSAIVRVGVSSVTGERVIEISIPREGRRRVLLNAKRPTSNSELAKTLPTVAFLPDDLDVVKGSPGLRREFVDDLAGQLSSVSAATQSDYSRALRQRNALLRHDGRRADPATIDVWDERVAASGSELVRQRLELLEAVEKSVQQAYATVAKTSRVAMSYRSSWTVTDHDWRSRDFRSDLLTALQERRTRDMDVRATTAGPHRDEPIFELDRRIARVQASQGEQRALALALRLASYSLLERRYGSPPILLLDDVFSELDVQRAAGVMSILPGSQVFVTSAREDEVPVEGRMWKVDAGRLT
jgi:DNA replication and repair protein RecF